MCVTMRRAWLVGVLLGLCFFGLAAGARADRLHKVREGETLSAIARRYKVSVAALRAHARISDDGALRPGEMLSVPSQGVVYVQAGQTLSHIARAHDCSIDALARANRIRPDASLDVGQRLVLPGSQVSLDREWGEPAEKGVVTLIDEQGQEVPVRLVDGQGRVSRRGLDVLAAMMGAEEHAGARAPNPRLALLLAHIADHFGGRPIRIVSGYRDAGGSTSETSRHVKGRALDIQVRGVPGQTVWELCRRLNGAGCGHYPRSAFTHVDVRGHRTQWVDWSGPGQKARYGTLRGPTRSRKRRARMAYPQVSGEIGKAVDVLEDRGDDHALAIAITHFADSDSDPPEDADIAEYSEAEKRRVCLADASFLLTVRSPLLLATTPAGD
jgi:uncharacterized protein YcbK (DUF882 family)/LysM repeat protein